MTALLLDTFTGRIRLEGLLATRTALHIGAGGSGDPMATDSPVVRDAAGRPYIPGSSLKGVLRSAVEALFRSADSGAAGNGNGSGETDAEHEHGPLWSCDQVGGHGCVDHEREKAIRKAVADKTQPGTKPDERAISRKIWGESCPVCKLFGSPVLASRVRFPDLRLAGDLPVLELRNGVGIQRDREQAAQGVLYDFEAVPPDTGFELLVLVDNPTDAEVGLLLYLFEELDHGNLTLGGKSSRGLGQMRVSWQRVQEITLARDNPFADLLSRRELLAGPEAPAAPAAVELPLPEGGDPATWKRLAELILELPKVDKSLLGQKASPEGLKKEAINEKLALGLPENKVRSAWDEVLKRFVASGFLVQRGDELFVAGREPAEEEPATAAEAPARDPRLQAVYDRFIGAMSELWQGRG